MKATFHNPIGMQPGQSATPNAPAGATIGFPEVEMKLTNCATDILVALKVMRELVAGALRQLGESQKKVAMLEDEIQALRKKYEPGSCPNKPGKGGENAQN